MLNAVLKPKCRGPQVTGGNDAPAEVELRSCGGWDTLATHTLPSPVVSADMDTTEVEEAPPMPQVCPQCC